MMPTPEERVRKVETAVLALAKMVFVNAAFEDKHPRAGGKFAKKAGPKLTDIQKRQIQSTVAAENAAKLKEQQANVRTSLKGQNAITAQDKAKAAAAKKKGGKKAPAKKADDQKKFMEQRAASDKAAADKAAAVKAEADKKAAATPTQAAPVDQAQAMLDKQAADNTAGHGTDAGDVADIAASELDPEQAAAIKDVVQSFQDEAAKDKTDPEGAKVAAQAAQWAAAAAVQGGRILQKVQDERDKMSAIVDDKSKPEITRKQAQRVMEAYVEVLKNVDY